METNLESLQGAIAVESAPIDNTDNVPIPLDIKPEYLPKVIPEAAGIVSKAQDVIVYTTRPEDIESMRARFMPLTIADVKDKEGLAKVRAARVEVKAEIAKVTAERKDFKAGVLEWGRYIDGGAKALHEQIQPILTHLDGEVMRIEAEQDRIREEKRQAATKRLQDRVSALNEVAGVVDLALLETISDSQFIAYLARATDAKRAADERNRIAALQAIEEAREAAQAIKEEGDRQALQREEQARQKAILDAQEADIKARQKAIDDATAEQDRQAAAAKLREQAIADGIAEGERRAAKAEADRIQMAKEAEDLRAKEIEEARDRQTKEAERLAAIAAAAPDAEKLERFADELSKIRLPVLTTDAGHLAGSGAIAMVGRTLNYIRAQAESLKDLKLP